MGRAHRQEAGQAAAARSSSQAGEELKTAAYEEALAWLYAQRRTAAREPSRARLLLDSLDVRFTGPAVHVVGTTGKGTVAAMVERGLRVAGWKTGRFLSPHVEDFRERIEAGGSPIEPENVVAFVTRVRGASLEPAPAFFEIAYAMALDHFARNGVTIAVIEAGVGARSDVTITLEHVVLTVLTNVSRDHAGTLGSTVAEIARDKAAAIRPGVPVVTGSRGVARAIVSARAEALGSPLHADPPGGARFDVPPHVASVDDPARRQNQRLAAAALRSLDVPEDAVASGLSAPPLPARRERFTVRGRSVILDGAHNPAAGAVLAHSLTGPVVLVFGALSRKDGARTAQALKAHASHVIYTEATPGDGYPKASANASVVLVADPHEALERALELCPPGGTIVVAGSMYLAGRIRKTLRELQVDVPD